MKIAGTDVAIAWLSTEQMIEVDRAMIEDFRIELIQMMENAGRDLAHLSRERFLGGDPRGKTTVVLAGPGGNGGNGGGAMVAARRLHAWGARVEVFLSRPDNDLTPVPAHQLDIVRRMGMAVGGAAEVGAAPPADLVIDGVIGYILHGPPRGGAAELIRWAGANQVWSWDITKQLGPAKWTYFYLYVIMDIFSRYTVGWMVAERESAALAQRLFDDTCAKEAIEPGQLVIHADRGPSMTSKTVAHLMADLGVTKSHSRPYTSNDNPFSESQFRTMKYCPAFPGQFGCVQDARVFGHDFFDWYNFEHRHSGIGYLTPAAVHFGLAEVITARRNHALQQAFSANPERFLKGAPAPPVVPSAVWINPRETHRHTQEDLQ